jgi:hypothetical protein
MSIRAQIITIICMLFVALGTGAYLVHDGNKQIDSLESQVSELKDKNARITEQLADREYSLVQRDREVIALIIELRSNLVECMFLHNACFDNLVECQEGQEEAEPKPPEEAGGGKRGI